MLLNPPSYDTSQMVISTCNFLLVDIKIEYTMTIVFFFCIQSLGSWKSMEVFLVLGVFLSLWGLLSLLGLQGLLDPRGLLVTRKVLKKNE